MNVTFSVIGPRGTLFRKTPPALTESASGGWWPRDRTCVHFLDEELAEGWERTRCHYPVQRSGGFLCAKHDAEVLGPFSARARQHRDIDAETIELLLRTERRAIAAGTRRRQRVSKTESVLYLE